MPDIFDLAQLSEPVAIRDTTANVSGLPIDEFVRTLTRFPDDLKKLRAGAAHQVDWAALSGGAVSALIAAAVGKPGDVAAEAFFRARLVAGEQAKLLSAIIRLSFPEGVAPLVELVQTIINATPSSNG